MILPRPQMLIFLVFMLCGQNSLAQESLFDWFQQDSLIEWTIHTDIKQLIKNKYKENYQPALLVYKQDSIVYQDSISIRTRGNSRKRICNFPPIKIRYDRALLSERQLKQYRDLKVVTHCKKSTTNENLLLREYLCYKLYSLLNPNSFRVQLVRINYVDSHKSRKVTRKYAFLIEPIEELADRLDAHIYKKKNIGIPNLHKEGYKQLSLFQFMIGNTDWRVKIHHNIKLLLSKDSTTFIPVPYDFDYSGLINADYAIPAKELNIPDVRTRLFMGPCWSIKAYQNSLNFFRQNKNLILDYCENFPYLDARNKRDVLNYLNTFFDLLKQERDLAAEMRWRCD